MEDLAELESNGQTKAMTNFSGEMRDSMERHRQVYAQGVVDHVVMCLPSQCTLLSPRLPGFLTGTLIDSLKAVERRFIMYGEKLTTADEEKRLKTIEKFISNAEKYSQTQLVKKQHCFARSCNPGHIHSDALRNCLSIFSRDLDLQGSCLLDELIACDVVSVSDEESIRGKKSRRTQSEELVSCLMGRMSVDQFDHVLLPALTRDHPHLVDCLLAEVERLEEEEEERQCVACRARSTIQVKRLATNLLMQKSIDVAVYSDLRGGGLSNSSKWAELRSVPDSAIIEAMKTKYPTFYQEFQEQGLSSLSCRCVCTDDGNVDGADIPEDTEDPLEVKEDSVSAGSQGTSQCDFDGCLSFEEEDMELVYKMTARPRGVCLIINNIEIKGHIYRTWSNKDANELKGLFEKLEFVVVTKTNLKSSEMISSLQEYANFNHTAYDAFVCCVLTYGDNNNICGTDREFMKVSELTSQLRSSACPTLAGKPKIFFINSNRGQRHMTGMRTSPSEAQPYSRYIADEADFLIGYSTSPDCKSFWHRSAGSDFISTLTRTLDCQSDRHDLLTCLMLVNQELGRRNMLHNNTLYKQVPAPVFTLTKKIFLSSDPVWPNTPDHD